MKRFFFLLFLWIVLCHPAFCQDSTIVQSGPALKRKLDVTLVVNNILITDTAKAAFILKNFSHVIVKRTPLSRSKALKKWGVSSRDGVLFCTMRKDVILDIDKMTIVEKID